MELSTLIHRARGLTDSRVAPSLGDSDFVAYANRAVREAAERSLCLRDGYDIDTAIGVGEYTIPLTDTRPESIVVQRVYVNGRAIAKGTFEQLEAWQSKNTTQDTPTTFAQRHQTLLLAPFPDEVLTITLSGVWYPMSQLDIDNPEGEPEIPEHLHDDLAAWMAYEAILAADAGDMRQERRTRLADRYLAQFTRRFGPARSAREMDQWREMPQERHVRGPGTV